MNIIINKRKENKGVNIAGILSLIVCFLFFTIVFASCENQLNEIKEPSVSKIGDIRFKIGFAPDTKVATGADFKSVFENGDKIGIFAVQRSSSGTATLQASGNYIHNLPLTYNDGNWSAGNEANFFYPNNGDVLDFYAYYPYDVNVTDPGNIIFNVRPDQSTATDGKSNYNISDLLTASPSTGIAKDELVQLAFNHKLTLVQVSITDPGAKFYVDNIFSITMQGIKTEATLNLGTDGVTATGDATGTVVLNRLEKPADANYETSFTFRALVPAQTVGVTADKKLFVFKRSATDNPFEFDYKSYTATTLAVGAAKRYEISLSLTAYKITIPTDFTKSSVVSVYANYQKIAEICREYIKGYPGGAATVIYPVDENQKRVNEGILTQDGGKVVWATDGTNAVTYTPGTAPVTVMYYSNSLTLEPVSNKEAIQQAEYFTDVEGRRYSIAKIGLQYWTRENLKTRKYIETNIDGTKKITRLQTSHIFTIWSDPDKPGCCVYDNIDAFSTAAGFNAYGVLYDWDIVTKGWLDYNNWYVPTKADLDLMASYAEWSSGIQDPTGAWNMGTANMTNNTGFSALPGGYRDCETNGGPGLEGYFKKGEFGAFWSKTAIPGGAAGEEQAYILKTSADCDLTTRISANIIGSIKQTGHYVRLMRTSL